MLLTILSQLGQHNQSIGSPVVYYRQFLVSHCLDLEVAQIFINQASFLHHEWNVMLSNSHIAL